MDKEGSLHDGIPMLGVVYPGLPPYLGCLVPSVLE